MPIIDLPFLKDILIILIIAFIIFETISLLFKILQSSIKYLLLKKMFSHDLTVAQIKKLVDKW